MKLAATVLLASMATILALILVSLYFLDSLSADYRFSATRNSYSEDLKTHYERYIQFTGKAGELLFGFKEQDAMPDHAPISVILEPLRQDEIEAREEYSKSSEARNQRRFILGFSRMKAHPAGQNFKGDYVTVKIKALYIVISLCLLLTAGVFCLLHRKTKGGASLP